MATSQPVADRDVSEEQRKGAGTKNEHQRVKHRNLAHPPITARSAIGKPCLRPDALSCWFAAYTPEAYQEAM
jgi:hypothetical protein